MPLTDIIKAQQEKVNIDDILVLSPEPWEFSYDLKASQVKLNQAIADTARAAYQQALADVRAGVPPKSEPRGPWESAECMGVNDCRTAVLEHLDLLGKE
jgi:hypothetical protein